MAASLQTAVSIVLLTLLFVVVVLPSVSNGQTTSVLTFVAMLAVVLPSISNDQTTPVLVR